MPRFDVFGVCNALFDIQANVGDAALAGLGLAKGSSTLADEERLRRVLEAVGTGIVHTEAGGSGANTMLGIAVLGGRACFTSRVGDDEHGRLYRASLEGHGVKANLSIGSGRTGTALVLVSPDAQRTMLACLGDSRNLTKDDVDLDDLAASQVLYVTGYMWDTDAQKEAVRLAMDAARRHGVKVAFSLSDPFCVDRNREDFRRLIAESVDILFGNGAEAQALTGAPTPHEAARALTGTVETAAVTLDARGSLVASRDALHEIAPHRVAAIDTTGAGDAYAAGLLYGMTRGLPLDAAGRIASYCAAQVVARYGPRLEGVDRAAIEALIRG